MPGVPTSKGCKACAKQKKKCDQAKPSCSRCARLKIPCVGAGEQKYIFKPVTFQGSPSQSAGQSSAGPLTAIARSNKRRQSSASDASITISALPQNVSTVLASKFIAALEVEDLRYSLRCYGDFLEQIPKRLGHSDALDASVKALSSVFSVHYTRQLPPDALVNYINALKALRLCLSCKDEKLAPETLSAIYIMMICQGWIGRSDDHVRSHGEILMHLASSAIVQKWKGPFELRLLETLFVPLVLEAMVNPGISMESWFNLIDSCVFQRLTERRQEIDIRSLNAQKLVRMPVFFHDPTAHLAEIKSAYEEMRADEPKLRQYLADLEQEIYSSSGPKETTVTEQRRLFHKFQVVYGVLLTVSLALNSLLRAFHPKDAELLVETACLADNFIALAKNASKHRPLGAGYLPPCLAAVWATTEALPAQQAELQRLMEEYQPDSPQIKWMEQAVWLNASHKALLGLLTGPPGRKLSFDPQDMLNISIVHCKAAFGSSGSCLFI